MCVKCNNQLAVVNTSTGSATPLICCGGKARNSDTRFNASRVALVISSEVPTTLFSPSMRDATFTVFPITVNSIRSGEPMLPTMAGPVLMPMPILMESSPRCASSRLSRSSFHCMAHPAASALSGCCGCRYRPEERHKPSSRNLLTFRRAAFNHLHHGRNSFNRRTASAGARWTERSVKDRISTNITVISVPCRRGRDPAPKLLSRFVSNMRAEGLTQPLFLAQPVTI